MNRTNILSCVLVMLFMVSCMCFFSVNAEPDSIEETTTTTEAVLETTTQATTITTNQVTTTVATQPTTQATAGTTRATTQKTKKVTSADPSYTKKTATTKANATAGGYVTSGYQDYATGGTKETKEIKSTEATTEPTTAAKNIVNYASKYRPMKWLSLAVMIACVIALVAINVRYKKKYGKFKQNKNGKANGKAKNSSKKNEAPKLDTSAKFDNANAKPTKQNQKSPASADNNFDKTTVVDISSFSNKNNNAFKPKSNSKSVEKDVISDKKEKDDDDLYI